jgi:hypothetical protein
MFLNIQLWDREGIISALIHSEVLYINKWFTYTAWMRNRGILIGRLTRLENAVSKQLPDLKPYNYLANGYNQRGIPKRESKTVDIRPAD